MHSCRDRGFFALNPCITRRGKATPVIKKTKQRSPDEMRYDGVVIARRFITCVLIVLFIFNVYGRIYTPPEWRK